MNRPMVPASSRWQARRTQMRMQLPLGAASGCSVEVAMEDGLCVVPAAERESLEKKFEMPRPHTKLVETRPEQYKRELVCRCRPRDRGVAENRARTFSPAHTRCAVDKQSPNAWRLVADRHDIHGHVCRRRPWATLCQDQCTTPRRPCRHARIAANAAPALLFVNIWLTRCWLPYRGRLCCH